MRTTQPSPYTGPSSGGRHLRLVVSPKTDLNGPGWRLCPQVEAVLRAWREDIDAEPWSVGLSFDALWRRRDG
jgi:hypothetical protein